MYEKVLSQLVDVYKQVKIGDPLEKGTLLGPLHTKTSKENFLKGIEAIKAQVCLDLTKLFNFTCVDMFFSSHLIYLL